MALLFCLNQDLQDSRIFRIFFHLLHSKHFLLLYLAQPFAILAFFMLLIKELMALFSSDLH
jgi:hypothetical protein